MVDLASPVAGGVSVPAGRQEDASLAALVGKLRHSLPSVRARALQNLHFKLSRGLVQPGEIAHDRRASEALVGIISSEDAPYQDLAAAVGIATSLSAHPAGASQLLHTGVLVAVDDVRKRLTSSSAPTGDAPALLERVEALAARVPAGAVAGGTGLAEPSADAARKPARAGHKSCGTDCPASGREVLRALARQDPKLQASLASVLKAERDLQPPGPPVVEEGGWRLARAPLSAGDEARLTDAGLQVEHSGDPRTLAAALDGLSRTVAADVPAECILAHGGIVPSVLKLLGGGRGAAGRGGFGGHGCGPPPLLRAAAGFLETMARGLKRSLVAAGDPGLRCCPPGAPGGSIDPTSAPAAAWMLPCSPATVTTGAADPTSVLCVTTPVHAMALALVPALADPDVFSAAMSALRDMLPLLAPPRPDRPPKYLARRLRELLVALDAAAATIAARELPKSTPAPPAHHSRAAAACVVFAAELAATCPAEVVRAETPATLASRIGALCLDQVAAAALTPGVCAAVRAATEAACAVETEILRAALAAEGPAGRLADSAASVAATCRRGGSPLAALRQVPELLPAAHYAGDEIEKMVHIWVDGCALAAFHASTGDVEEDRQSLGVQEAGAVLELMIGCRTRAVRTAATVRVGALLDGSARVAASGDAAAVGAALLLSAAPAVRTALLAFAVPAGGACGRAAADAMLRVAGPRGGELAPALVRGLHHWRPWLQCHRQHKEMGASVRALLELAPVRKPRAVAEAWTWLRAPLRDLFARDAATRRAAAATICATLPAAEATAAAEGGGSDAEDPLGLLLREADPTGPPEPGSAAAINAERAARQFGEDDVTSLEAVLLSDGLEAEVRLSAGHQLLLLARAGRLDGRLCVRSARPGPMLLGCLQLARAAAECSAAVDPRLGAVAADILATSAASGPAARSAILNAANGGAWGAALAPMLFHPLLSLRRRAARLLGALAFAEDPEAGAPCPRQYVSRSGLTALRGRVPVPPGCAEAFYLPFPHAPVPVLPGLWVDNAEKAPQALDGDKHSRVLRVLWQRRALAEASGVDGLLQALEDGPAPAGLGAAAAAAALGSLRALSPRPAVGGYLSDMETADGHAAFLDAAAGLEALCAGVPGAAACLAGAPWPRALHKFISSAPATAADCHVYLAATRVARTALMTGACDESAISFAALALKGSAKGVLGEPITTPRAPPLALLRAGPPGDGLESALDAETERTLLRLLVAEAAIALADAALWAARRAPGADGSAAARVVGVASAGGENGLLGLLCGNWAARPGSNYPCRVAAARCVGRAADLAREALRRGASLEREAQGLLRQLAGLIVPLARAVFLHKGDGATEPPRQAVTSGGEQDGDEDAGAPLGGALTGSALADTALRAIVLLVSTLPRGEWGAAWGKSGGVYWASRLMRHRCGVRRALAARLLASLSSNDAEECAELRAAVQACVPDLVPTACAVVTSQCEAPVVRAEALRLLCVAMWTPTAGDAPADGDAPVRGPSGPARVLGRDAVWAALLELTRELHAQAPALQTAVLLFLREAALADALRVRAWLVEHHVWKRVVATMARAGRGPGEGDGERAAHEAAADALARVAGGDAGLTDGVAAGVSGPETWWAVAGAGAGLVHVLCGAGMTDELRAVEGLQDAVAAATAGIGEALSGGGCAAEGERRVALSSLASCLLGMNALMQHARDDADVPEGVAAAMRQALALATCAPPSPSLSGGISGERRQLARLAVAASSLCATATRSEALARSLLSADSSAAHGHAICRCLVALLASLMEGGAYATAASAACGGEGPLEATVRALGNVLAWDAGAKTAALETGLPETLLGMARDAHAGMVLQGARAGAGTAGAVGSDPRATLAFARVGPKARGSIDRLRKKAGKIAPVLKRQADGGADAEADGKASEDAPEGQPGAAATAPPERHLVWAVTLMRHLVIDCPAAQERLTSAGVFALVEAAWGLALRDDKLLYEILALLANLWYACPAAVRAAAELHTPGLPQVISCELLASLASFEDGARAMLRSAQMAGMVDLLLDAAAGPHAGASRAALLCLRNLAFTTDAKAHFLASPRTLEIVVAAAELGTADPESSASAAAALWALVYNGERVKAALRRMSSVEARLEDTAGALTAATYLAKSREDDAALRTLPGALRDQDSADGSVPARSHAEEAERSLRAVLALMSLTSVPPDSGDVGTGAAGALAVA
ncbi:unnamed protein product [Pedinophyceae sp. YPF-701]|nr:unnamed protein product [Pedinophyceae sp. YPF-701]